jgi:hypothetical protein
MSIEVRGREKTVPTDMRVKVDDTWEVSYVRSIGEFAYEFKVFPMTGAEEAVKKVVDAMEEQSYDHGAEWRRTYINELANEDDIYRVFKVGFRVRDSY